MKQFHYYNQAISGQYLKQVTFPKKVTLASTASQKFNVTIFPQALRNLLREGRDQIMPPGPKPVMNNEDLKE
jgi:hypothetical protein